MNPYKILGVSKDADAETIKKTYRSLVKKCHPDTHPGDKQAEEQFKQISLAYDILSNEEKRKEYDQKTLAKENKVKPQGQKVRPVQPANFQQEFEQFFNFGGMGKTTDKKAENIVSMDTSALFEKYMGFR